MMPPPHPGAVRNRPMCTPLVRYPQAIDQLTVEPGRQIPTDHAALRIVSAEIQIPTSVD